MAKSNKRSKLTRYIQGFKSDAQFRAGVIGIVLLLLVVALTPVLVTHDAHEFGSLSLGRPGQDGHLLGTNHMGQDVYSMIIEGTSTSLKVAVISSMISAILGILVGGIAGFFGGKTDIVISESINAFLMIPTFFLVLLVIALFGNSITNQALSLRERTFVKSAVALGETRLQILTKYILPNGIFPVVANTTRGMAGAILTEASLSFLGLGDPNIISWGQMIYAGKNYITTGWWVSTFAGIATIITVVIFYLLGDGMNHVLNPKYSFGKGGGK